MEPILKVENLSIEIETREGKSSVVDDLSFELSAGQTLSFVGESGCGKSITALGVMGLLPEKISQISAGKIFFQGEGKVYFFSFKDSFHVVAVPMPLGSFLIFFFDIFTLKFPI